MDLLLSDMQAGFRKERSCTDQIVTLRIILEQSAEWNTPLYINFVDFEKAFHIIHRDSLWKQWEMKDIISSMVLSVFVSPRRSAKISASDMPLSRLSLKILWLYSNDCVQPVSVHFTVKLQRDAWPRRLAKNVRIPMPGFVSFYPTSSWERGCSHLWKPDIWSL